MDLPGISLFIVSMILVHTHRWSTFHRCSLMWLKYWTRVSTTRPFPHHHPPSSTNCSCNGWHRCRDCGIRFSRGWIVPRAMLCAWQCPHTSTSILSHGPLSKVLNVIANLHDGGLTFLASSYKVYPLCALTLNRCICPFLSLYGLRYSSSPSISALAWKIKAELW